MCVHYCQVVRCQYRVRMFTKYSLFLKSLYVDYGCTLNEGRQPHARKLLHFVFWGVCREQPYFETNQIKALIFVIASYFVGLCSQYEVYVMGIQIKHCVTNHYWQRKITGCNTNSCQRREFSSINLFQHINRICQLKSQTAPFLLNSIPCDLKSQSTGWFYIKSAVKNVLLFHFISCTSVFENCFQFISMQETILSL